MSSMSMSEAQASTLVAVALTAPVVKVEIHPYSGAITVTTGEWGGRGPVVLIEQDGRISYDQVADTAARREAQA